MPCIAVIDEDDNDYYDNTADWIQFRADYRYRPFCLLIPYDPSSQVTIPSEALSDPRFQVHNVTRDEGSGTADDWFNICGLGKLTASNVRFLGLFVDESGSMTKSTVLNSYNKFIADVAAANIKICEVHDSNEDWTTPFMTTLTPNGICKEAKPSIKTSTVAATSPANDATSGTTSATTTTTLGPTPQTTLTTSSTAQQRASTTSTTLTSISTASLTTTPNIVSQRLHVLIECYSYALRY
jgi:hypothetical protein